MSGAVHTWYIYFIHYLLIWKCHNSEERKLTCNVIRIEWETTHYHFITGDINPLLEVTFFKSHSSPYWISYLRFLSSAETVSISVANVKEIFKTSRDKNIFCFVKSMLTNTRLSQEKSFTYITKRSNVIEGIGKSTDEHMVENFCEFKIKSNTQAFFSYFSSFLAFNFVKIYQMKYDC